MKRKTEKFLTVVGIALACAGIYFIGTSENWAWFAMLAELGILALGVGVVIKRM